MIYIIEVNIAAPGAQDWAPVDGEGTAWGSPRIEFASFEDATEWLARFMLDMLDDGHELAQDDWRVREISGRGS